MKKIGFATALAGGAVAAVIGLAAPAQAAPSGPGNAQQTISDLQAQGYTVIVNRTGTTPLEEGHGGRGSAGADVLPHRLGQPGRQQADHRHRQDGLRGREVIPNKAVHRLDIMVGRPIRAPHLAFHRQARR